MLNAGFHDILLSLVKTAEITISLFSSSVRSVQRLKLAYLCKKDVMANNESLDEQQNYEATAKKDGKLCVITFSNKTNADGVIETSLVSSR